MLLKLKQKDIDLVNPEWENVKYSHRLKRSFRIYMFFIAPIIFITILALVFIISTYPLTSAYIAYWTNDDSAFKNALSNILARKGTDLSDGATYTVKPLSSINEKKNSYSYTPDTSKSKNKNTTKSNSAKEKSIKNKKANASLPVEESDIRKKDETNHIVVPKIELNVPFISVSDNNNNTIKKALEKGVVHYANTALPGTVGTFALTGHSSNYWWEEGKYNIAFALLEKLENGDDIIVYYNGDKYIYKVFDKKIIEADDRSAFKEEQGRHLITLSTCWPLMTNWKRLVVWGEQVFPLPEK